MLQRLSIMAAMVGLSLAPILLPSARAEITIAPPAAGKQVDLVIALDVSGSMSGLIDSAKQRLWDIVNELGQATPQPELRVAILSYGNPNYGSQTGNVRIDQPLTNDLDAVNKTLFAFQTNGGDEYVARVVDRSIRSLQWSQDPGALRIIFVAGNESAAQDPQIPLEAAAAHALQRDIVVNTIYCGGANDSDSVDWQRFASLSDGIYASIDQHAAAVANLTTPMDDKLLELNKALNQTYVSYGRKGKEYRRNQIAQDENAARMSAPAAASRAVTKGGGMYDSSHWDMVDALESGKALDEFAEEDLPAEMQAMSAAEREEYIVGQSRKREQIKGDIAALAGKRQDYIEEKRKEAQADSAQGLDEVIQSGLRSVASKKGFSFD